MYVFSLKHTVWKFGGPGRVARYVAVVGGGVS